MVDQKELARIEGFDEDTARELQERAKEYLEKQEAELDAKRKELGVDDAVRDVPGITTAMMVALGENGVKTVEDLAGCATDDLTGWTERKDGEAKREPGFFDGLDVIARGRRSPDHAGPRQGRLGHRGRTRRGSGRSSASGRRSRRRRSGAGVMEHERTICSPARSRTRISTAARRRAGEGAFLRADARTRKSGRRSDPLRGGARRRGSARRQAQIARPRHLDHRHARGHR